MGCFISSTPVKDEGPLVAEEEYPSLNITENHKQNVLTAAKYLQCMMKDNLHQFKASKLFQNVGDYPDVPWKKRLMQNFGELKSFVHSIKQQQQPVQGEKAVEYVFFISLKKLRTLGMLLTHEEARQQEGLLLQIPTIEVLGRSQADFNKWAITNVEPKGKKKAFHYVSHKWNGKQVDDEEGNLFKKMVKPNKKWFSLIGGDDADCQYLWFDLLSVPQTNEAEKQQVLANVPFIMRKFETIFLDPNEECARAFHRSVWCQLECLARQTRDGETLFTSENTDIFEYEENRSWKMNNWEDVFSMLPGFIECFCDSAEYYFVHRTFDNFARYGWLRSHVLLEILNGILQRFKD